MSSIYSRKQEHGIYQWFWMINTLSIVFIMHQWECILKLIQYQIPCMKQVAWTFSLTNRLEMVMFLLLSCDVLGSELLWNCIIKHHKYNYHKVAPFLLIYNVLFVRIQWGSESYVHWSRALREQIAIAISDLLAFCSHRDQDLLEFLIASIFASNHSTLSNSVGCRFQYSSFTLQFSIFLHRNHALVFFRGDLKCSKHLVELSVAKQTCMFRKSLVHNIGFILRLFHSLKSTSFVTYIVMDAFDKTATAK